MTLDQWLDRSSGYTVTLPAGTRRGNKVVHREGDAWIDGLPPGGFDQHTCKYVQEVTTQDALVTILLDHDTIRTMALRAIFHRANRSTKAGPVTVKAERARGKK